MKVPTFKHEVNFIQMNRDHLNTKDLLHCFCQMDGFLTSLEPYPSTMQRKPLSLAQINVDFTINFSKFEMSP